MKTEPRVWEVLEDTLDVDVDDVSRGDELSSLGDHMQLDAFYDALELEFESVVEEDERQDWVHVRDVMQWAEENAPVADDALVRYHIENTWRDEMTAAQTAWLVALRALGPGALAFGVFEAFRNHGESSIAWTLLGIALSAMAWFGPRAFFSFVTDEGRRVPRIGARTHLWVFLASTTALSWLGFALLQLGILA